MRRPLLPVRTAVLMLAALLALAAPAAAAGPDRRPVAPDRRPAVTAMAYNIHHGEGTDGVLDLDRIAQVIRASGADLVALQEVDRHWSERSLLADQAAELGAALDMEVAYGANLDHDPAAPGQPRRQYGTAILSRHPILASRNIPLPNIGGEQRGLLEAVVAVDGLRTRVYSTHFQHNNAVERRLQADAVRELIGTPDDPVLLMGDLNAVPEAPELAGLLPAFRDAAAGAGPTYPAEAPDRRIDYVLVSPWVEVTGAEVLSTPASDHLPVVADLLLARARPDQPLERAHAHNDYEHDRPLFDALDQGFTSVEADVWLVDGELLVAHDLEDVQPGRTLSSSYLDPLAALVRANHRSVYGQDVPFQLLIDIKSDGEATYRALDAVLREYRPMLSIFTRGRTVERAVTPVISGNRPRALMASQRVRLAGYDGRLPDLATDTPATFMPLVSDSWERTFTWRGVGPMPPPERARLEQVVATAHDRGMRVRFWATPDQPGSAREAVWSQLLAADVDHLNTDDLRGLAAWLRANDPQEQAPPAAAA